MNTDNQGNIYIPYGLFITSIPATTGEQSKVLVPGANGRVASATISQLITQSGGSIVSSVFNRTGNVIAQDGDYKSHQITETTNLYYTDARARLALNLTTFGTSGAATYDSKSGILNIPQYGGGLVGNYVPVTRTITINGQSADLSSDRIFSIDSMVYPSAGIPVSTGIGWGTSITNNSTNWNTAYGWGNHASAGYLTSFTETDPIWTADKPNYATKTYVDTSVSNLVASAPAALNTLNELALALGSDANFSTTITTLIGTKEPAITAGTTTQYWRGDKTWQTLPSYTLPTATDTVLGGVKIGSGITITSGVISVSTSYQAPLNGTGIVKSTTGTITYLTDNTANWDTAYTDRNKWDGGSTGLVATTGRTSLGLGTAALAASTDFAAASHTHTIANITGLQTALDGKEPTISVGTTAQYWRGDKTWQTLPSYTLPKASDTVLGGIKVGTNLSIDANGVLSSTDTNTTYANFTRTVAGLVPNPGGATTNRYLREDGTWVVPPDTDTDTNTTYSLSIPTSTTKLRLTGSDTTTSDITFTAGTNITITRTSASEFTIASSYTDTNTWNANTKTADGYVTAPGAVANKVWKTDASGNPGWRDDADTDTNTWNANTKDVAGYVAAPGAVANKVWKTDANGNPAWRDDTDTIVTSLAWSSITSKPTDVSYFTNDASYITSASNVVGLYGSGYGNGNFTWNQTPNAFAGYSGWASYMINNHGDGSNYYNQTIIMPFWGPPQYSRREANVLRGPYGFITDENIGGQSVNYAATAGNSSTVGGYGAGSFVLKSGDTMSNRLTIDTRTTTNLPLHILAVEPWIQLEATGSTNWTAIRMYPTGGYNAVIGNYNSGELVFVAGGVEMAFLNSTSIRVPKYRFYGNSTLSGNGTAEIVDIANVGMAMQSLNYRWYNNTANVLYMTLDYNGNLTANAFFESSDIRYKDVIETNPNVTLEGLDVIKFTRKGNKVVRYGYSAQQVKKLSEDLVGGTVDDLTVNYSDVHTLKIAALEKRIAELEAKLNSYGV